MASVCTSTTCGSSHVKFAIENQDEFDVSDESFSIGGYKSGSGSGSDDADFLSGEDDDAGVTAAADADNDDDDDDDDDDASIASSVGMRHRTQPFTLLSTGWRATYANQLYSCMVHKVSTPRGHGERCVPHKSPALSRGVVC
jgi:hypothetical protein